MALRWGIVGAGKISHEFACAIQTFPNDHQVVAVGSNKMETATKFAEEHNIPLARQGYNAIATDPNIDVVYIGNLNTQHFDTAKLMLENGKPVLCEKPFTINEKQTRKLVEISRAKKVFLMEAVWSRCFPAYIEARKRIDSGEIGDVIYASAHFGFPLQHIERLTAKNLGGGAILDLGVYVLQFQQFVFRGLKPIKVSVNGVLNVENGVDESVGAVITYPGGKMAVVSASARVTLPNEGVISGTKGNLRLPRFWCPVELITDQETLTFKLPESSTSNKKTGLVYEAQEVKKCLAEGKIESSQMPHEESIELARLMDLMRKEIGVEFPEDMLTF